MLPNKKQLTNVVTHFIGPVNYVCSMEWMATSSVYRKVRVLVLFVFNIRQ